MSIPLLDTFNVSAGIFPATTERTSLLSRLSSGDIGLVDGSSFLSGSGTVNYIPKFTSSGVLGNSVITEVNGNVGIGTESPSSRLHLLTTGNTEFILDARIAGTPILSLLGTLNSTPLIAFNGNGLRLSHVTGSGAAGNRPLVLLTSSGNLIINSLDDMGERFQVNGNVRISQLAAGSSADSIVTVSSSGVLNKVGFDTFVRSANQLNWADLGVANNVVGMLAWRNYSNNHVILDASSGILPNGTVISNSNSQVAWSPNFPTLMGWNGFNTYGVRVDSARVADGLASMNISQFTNNSGYITGVGTINYIPKFTASGSIGNASIVDVNGSIGIGTTSPVRKLDIVGGHTTTTFRLLYDESFLGRPISSLDFWASEPGVTFDGAGLGHNVNGHPFYGRRDTNTGQAYIRFINGNIGFHTNTGDAINRVNINNIGNLIIGGSIDTGEKLQVNGSAKITGTLKIDTFATPQTSDVLVTVSTGGVLSKYANMSSILLGTGDGGYLPRYVGTTGTPTNSMTVSSIYQSGNNIAIGKTNALYQLDVNSSFGVGGTSVVYNGLDNITTSVTSNISLIKSTGNMAINNVTGKFAIGRDTLFTSGAGINYKVQIDSGSSNGNGLFINGDIFTTSTWTSFSDIRLKSNIKKVDSALEKLMKISGYIYTINKKRTIGLISQEIEKDFPEAVEEKGGYLTLNYQGFSAVLVEAIKELKHEIEEIKKWQ